MKYKQDELDDEDTPNTFTICLDSLDDDKKDVQEQIDLELLEESPGNIIINNEGGDKISEIDNKLIFETEK